MSDGTNPLPRFKQALDDALDDLAASQSHCRELEEALLMLRKCMHHGMRPGFACHCDDCVKCGEIGDRALASAHTEGSTTEVNAAPTKEQ